MGAAPRRHQQPGGPARARIHVALCLFLALALGYWYWRAAPAPSRGKAVEAYLAVGMMAVGWSLVACWWVWAERVRLRRERAIAAVERPEGYRVGPLVDALAEVETPMRPVVLAALTPLRAEDLRGLSGRQHVVLYRQLAHPRPTDTRFVVALLEAIAEGGTIAATPYVERLAGSRDAFGPGAAPGDCSAPLTPAAYRDIGRGMALDRARWRLAGLAAHGDVGMSRANNEVIEAARRCLARLRERVAAAHTTNALLRPTQAPGAHALLRPAQAVEEPDATALLRPVGD